MKQCYPNTAIVGLQVDAEQFGGQQMTVNYHIRGRINPVPSNYDPEKRTYSGIWDGSLKPAYSNNPAWCLLGHADSPRPATAMGKRLGAADVDKWALYAIAQYCDQTVPDGFGGTEPRMTFNAYLSQQRKAWDVLSDFCSAMRCMPVWSGQTLTFVQDRPSMWCGPYTNSDVVVDDKRRGVSLQLQRPEGPPHGGGGELHRPAERLADLHGTGEDPEAILALRAQPAEDGCVRLPPVPGRPTVPGCG
ncbi:phage tail protein [Escherichia coli]|uniref:phage tail protein n=1 Tax=Escherichia coli TaxID=562 RepID=UPI00397EA79E